MTPRRERQEHHLPRGRALHAAIAVAVTAVVIIVLFWLDNFAPAFRSFFGAARWVALALGVYWLYHALRPRRNADRRDGDRRDHRRRTSDPPLQPDCDAPTTEPRTPGETRRGA